LRRTWIDAFGHIARLTGTPRQTQQQK
jgi:hypothetical protein